jgi:hypothetical protein
MMRFVFALLACLIAAPASAQLSGGLMFPGPGTAHSTGGAFVGPADVSGWSAPSAWWGLRAMSSATRGNKVANVCNSTGGVDVGCADMFSDATTGDLVSATISSITCPGANCTVKTLYDQSGNTNCSAAACDVTQATISKRPTLVASVTGGKAAMLFANASFQLLSNASGITLAQPFTVSNVANKTGSGGTAILDSGVSSVQLGGNGANTWAMFAGAVQPTTTVNDAIFHAAQSLFNGNSLSTLYTSTDNVAASSSRSMLSIGGTGLSGVLGVGGNSSNQDWNGYITEVGVWSGDKTANNAAMDSNQRTYYGF